MEFLQTLYAFAMLALASSTRDTGKLVRGTPSISHSLVNLGKMQITLNFNGRLEEEDTKHADTSQSNPTESCVCSEFKPFGNSIMSNPSDIVTRILRSNDLFKDTTSSACCDSQENVQDNTVFLEMLPVKSNQDTDRNPTPVMHFPNFNQLLNKAVGVKQKAVEIILFPKRKDLLNFDYPNFIPKKPIRVIEASISENIGKDLPPTSVKKDLALSEKGKNLDTVEDVAVKTVTPSNSAVRNNNRL